MFLAAVIRLRLATPAVLPAYLGRATHSCLFELLRAADPQLATSLHAAEGAKGFTSSDLLRPPGGPRPPDELVREWRITSYDPDLTALLREHILPHLPPRLQIDEKPWVVEAVTTDAARHPLAGEADPARLAAAYLTARGAPADRLTLTFRSPTTFRSQGRNVPLPLPDLVFGSYLDRWNAVLAPPIDPELRRVAAEVVWVSRYRLETVLVPIESGARQVGFVGACQFTIRHADPAWRRLLHLLAAFAFWCGTGYKTPWGLGQTTLTPAYE